MNKNKVEEEKGWGGGEEGRSTEVHQKIKQTFTT